MPGKKTSGAAAPSNETGKSGSNKRSRPAEAEPEAPAENTKRAKVSAGASDEAPEKQDAVTEQESGAGDAETTASDKDATQSDEDEPASPLSGKFDLYSMSLSFMNSKYAVKGKDSNPEALYLEMRKYQAKNDRTAKIMIPDDPLSSSEDGTFRSGVFRDPFEEMPFDICLSNLRETKEGHFKSDYAAPKANVWRGPGIKASMEIEDGGCGIAHSSGELVMQPLWKSKDADGKTIEIFEGTLKFKVGFSGLYSRKGHGSGIPLTTIDFWAIRSL